MPLIPGEAFQARLKKQHVRYEKWRLINDKD